MTASMKDFREWVEDLGLYDMPLLGRKFTWYGPASCSRIDRIFVEGDWLFKFQNLKVEVLNRSLSDHCSLVLEDENIDWGPKPFRSLDIWFSHDGFYKLVQEEWKRLGNKKIYEKFRKLKDPIRTWNRKEFGLIDDKIKELENEIQKIDNTFEKGHVDEAEVDRRAALVSMCETWYDREDSYWKQLSRDKLANEMDRNTRYFQSIAASRRRKKQITSLCVNGREIREVHLIKKEIRETFQKLYSREDSIGALIPENLVQTMSMQEANSLERLPTFEEIKEAVWQCNPSKAPGADGYNMNFIQKMWAEIGKEFAAEVKEFFITGKLKSDVNMTWVVLIPKTEIASEIKDYRPISMVGCIYKVISKVLVGRLKRVMPKLVGETQSAFVAGRQILDGALITCEAVQWLKKKKKEAVILKLDFQKAYDMVSWDFVDLTLMRMGFGVRWRGWIKECISSASMAILVNGVPTKPFKMERGLRQGDPISPFLFVLVAEVLNKFIEQAVLRGRIDGLSIDQNGVVLTHLQFADDTILFCPNKEVTLKNYILLLDCFCSISGLCINYKKSKIVPLNCNEEWVLKLQRKLGCEIVSLPFMYLGIPVGANPKRVKTWERVIEKVENRLSLWRSRYITKAGKLVLIKAVLNNLPIYYLSLFRMPAQVVNKIISLQSRFFWGKANGGRGIATVKWSQIQLPKDQGGLGVGNLVIKNSALLFKWWWRYAKEDCPLWKKVVKSCNKMGNSFPPSKPIGGPWQEICRLPNKSEWIQEICRRGIRYEVGDGEKTLFWEDLWVGDKMLKDDFPELYEESELKEQRIAECGFWDGIGWVWNLLWKSELAGPNLALVADLYGRLQQAKMHFGQEDKIVWKFEKNGIFTTKSVVKFANKHSNIVSNSNSFNYCCSIWKGLVPPRVEMLAWFVISGRINTMDRLIKLGIIQPLDGTCVLCRDAQESVNHLFLCCEFAQNLWDVWKQNWGITWVGPGSAKDFFEAWMATPIRRGLRREWRSAFFVTIWTLWRVRNMCIFEGKAANVNEAIATARFWLKEWVEKIKNRRKFEA